MLSRLKTATTLGSLSSSTRYVGIIDQVQACFPRPDPQEDALKMVRVGGAQKRTRPAATESSRKKLKVESAPQQQETAASDEVEQPAEENDMEHDDSDDESEDSDDDDEDDEEDEDSEDNSSESQSPDADEELNDRVEERRDDSSFLLKDLDSDPAYQLMLRVNDLLLEIDDEIKGTVAFVIEIYKNKFPELPSIISNPLDLIRVIERIGNEMDLSEIDLRDLVSNQQLMVLSVSSASTMGKPLTAAQWADALRGCQCAMTLFKDKSYLLSFVSKHINQIAPNLSALIGSALTAQLVGLTGGIVALAKIPACNIQVIGQQRQSSFGLSRLAAMPHAGILATCDLVQDSPPDLQKKTLKILGSKVALAARVDAYQVHFDNTAGHRLRREICGKLDKLQEPAKARTKKALPIPMEKKKARRGGRRMRKMKERFAVTDLQKAQNKIHFSLDGGEYGESAMGVDNLQVMTSQGSGRLRGPQQSKSKFLQQKKRVAQVSTSGQSGGMSSSLVFTPVQGLELVDPSAAAEKLKDVNKKWFDAHSGFVSALPKNK